jgi:hypothetical protein
MLDGVDGLLESLEDPYSNVTVGDRIRKTAIIAWVVPFLHILESLWL